MQFERRSPPNCSTRRRCGPGWKALSRSAALQGLRTRGPGRPYHQIDSPSRPRARSSSRSQRPAERYFQPPSANSMTTFAGASSSAATRIATCSTPPAETPAKMPSSAREQPQAAHGLGVRDEQLAVELGDVEHLGHVAVLERAQARDVVARERLGGDDLHVGVGLAQAPADAHQRAARAEAGDERVDVGALLEDLDGGRAVVHARVRRVRVLERHVQRAILARRARARARPRRSTRARRAS